MVENGEKLSKYERDNYIIKLQKEFAYAGAVIPDEITINDERIRLKSIVFNAARNKGSFSQKEIENFDRIIGLLKKKRQEIINRISREDISKQEAEVLYREALGLNRAIDTLYRAPEPKSTLEEESRKAKIEDGRRWINLVRKVYSRERKDDQQRRLE